MEIVLIGDERVRQIPAVDQGEPMIDLGRVFPQLRVDAERRFVQKKSQSIFWVRRQVGEMLVRAQAALPAGISLLIKECYRPLWVQKISFDGYCAELRKQFPDWDEQRIFNECCRLNAPLDVAPHSTGGAVDLTLIDHQGRWLEMGTEFNAEPLATDGATYTRAENISVEAKKNRRFLIEAMTQSGFVNYPTEWWHWSYGDKYWAFMTKTPAALYGSHENFEEHPDFSR